MTIRPNPAAEPVPWPFVALAVLPGLLMTLGPMVAGNSPVTRALMIGALAGPAVAGLIIAVARRSFAALPAWSLISVGYLTFLMMFLPEMLFSGREGIALIVGLALLIIALVVVVRRERPGRPPAMSLWLLAAAAAAHLLQLALLGGYRYYSSTSVWFILALPLAAGLLLAPTHGLRAALLLLPIGSFLMSFDIEHVIYFWEAPGWSQALTIAMPLLFLVAIPLWVLRARSLRMQAVGLLLPPVPYYLLLVVALYSNSFLSSNPFGINWNQILSIARPVIALFTILAVCGAVFVWLWRGDGREETADLDPAATELALDH